MAADRMAKNLLGLAESADTDSVKLAATNSALDRSGLAAKSALSVEVSAKPFELVFDKISGGPRQHTPALTEIESVSEDVAVIEGEYDEDPLEDEDEIVKDCGYTSTQR